MKELKSTAWIVLIVVLTALTVEILRTTVLVWGLSSFGYKVVTTIEKIEKNNSVRTPVAH